ncbi:MAG: hypothetical protein H7145_20615 [Akkermansiaceae bacterium]|nr:hypothetical protein [Armatimonadota bacterium]
MKNSAVVVALLASLTGWIGSAAFGQETQPSGIVIKKLSAPPTVATPRSAVTSAKTRLVLVSRKPNEITDDEAWFVRTGVQLPNYRFGAASPEDYGDLPRGAALTYEGLRLRRALNTANSGSNRFLAIYGSDSESERYLVCMNGFNGEYLYSLDFSNYRSPADSEKGDSLQPIGFACEDKNGTLYVSNGINGYAKEARNKTGYVTALEPKTGKMLWRSGPLTQNASTFADLGDALVCGYGFTAEPDFLYLLDKRTGRKTQTIPLKSGPAVILRKGERVYVRCYDTDYVFAIRR